jgi:hypothetical protein
MAALKVVIFDAKTSQTTERDLTAFELAELKDTNDKAEIEKANLDAKLVARASALSKLAALGLTEAEIAAL